jgi:hypothetical protein
MAANRVGKSEAGAYELTCHLTGLYPHWWTGRRFTGPVECWAVGTNSQTTRDIVQAKLLGSVQEPGMGMIPAHLIARTITARGLAGALEGAQVRHVTGGMSTAGAEVLRAGPAELRGHQQARHLVRRGTAGRLLHRDALPDGHHEGHRDGDVHPVAGHERGRQGLPRTRDARERRSSRRSSRRAGRTCRTWTRSSAGR